jgi:hypothetical protein
MFNIPKLLKREVGEIPTRSRHCKWEQTAMNHCMNVREGAVSNDHKPGDLPDIITTGTTRIGRCNMHEWLFMSKLLCILHGISFSGMFFYLVLHNRWKNGRREAPVIRQLYHEERRRENDE